MIAANPSSVDTRTHLQLFQTMLNIQPFNSEHAFLARNIKVNRKGKFSSFENLSIHLAQYWS